MLLDGVPSDVEAHGGSIVEQVNNPEVVRVASDGRFRLRVIPGAVVLRVQHPGYTPWSTTLDRVEQGETVELDEPIVLQGQPSRIEGTVRLLQYETAARLQGVDVALIDVRGDQRAVSPDGAGRFTVDNLGAGDYTLRFDAVGYEPVESAVTLGWGRRCVKERFSSGISQLGPTP